MHDYNVKVPNFTFCEGHEHLQQLAFFPWTSTQSLRILTPEKFTNIWWIEQDEIRVIKFEAAQIHFLSDVFPNKIPKWNFKWGY